MTIEDRMRAAGRATTGFDYLRIILALAVLCFHSVPISGQHELDGRLWLGPLRFLPEAILPLFFALSGFLVAGSLLRTRLHQFVLLRVLRIVPALAAEITLSALLIGLAFTTLPWRDYIMNREFVVYFLNIIGYIHYQLPGVFATNSWANVMNAQLWTIPFELYCYLALLFLALFKLITRRRAFVLLVVVATAALTVHDLFWTPMGQTWHISGRALVLCFLAAVALYLYRDQLPYSTRWGIVSAVVAAVLLQIPYDLPTYFAVFPVAYLSVWLGLMSPPRIPFGDLSYGVYLFHFPIEQSVAHLFPTMQAWWQITLMALPPTLLCAFLSWTLIENPILGKKRQILAWVDNRLAMIGTRARLPIVMPVPAAAADIVPPHPSHDRSAHQVSSIQP
jgi:peptidoglycan/LPS O-acetylase OafA/YrhL